MPDARHSDLLLGPTPLAISPRLQCKVTTQVRKDLAGRAFDAIGLKLWSLNGLPCERINYFGRRVVVRLVIDIPKNVGSSGRTRRHCAIALHLVMEFPILSLKIKQSLHARVGQMVCAVFTETDVEKKTRTSGAGWVRIRVKEFLVLALYF